MYALVTGGANPRRRALNDPRVFREGPDLGAARAAAILLHGRGGSAEGMLELARAIGAKEVTWLAPQAAGGAWYPYSFLAAIESNEPWLSASLDLVDQLVAHCSEAGLPSVGIAIGGFSQGACLASEYAARNAQRYGALLLFSGGLIGPPGTPREYAGSLAGTPVLLGCSDVDPHIPVERVHETARVLGSMGADVDERIYPGLGHTVVDDEIAAAAQILEGIPAAASVNRANRGRE